MRGGIADLCAADHGLLIAAITPDDGKGEAPLLPRLNRSRPIDSTARVHFKTVKPVQATGASHLNYVACDTDTWEQAATFQLEKLAKEGVVYCYARNDRLEFNIPYELYGNPHVYEPDFIVRLRNSVNVVDSKSKASSTTTPMPNTRRPSAGCLPSITGAGWASGTSLSVVSRSNLPRNSRSS